MRAWTLHAHWLALFSASLIYVSDFLSAVSNRLLVVRGQVTSENQRVGAQDFTLCKVWAQTATKTIA